MDNKKILDIKNQIDNLTSRVSMLEELHKETMEKINENQNICNHEFIFVNKKYENKAWDYLKYGKCLICGKGITLKPNNFELNDKIFIPEGNIIDVSSEVEDWTIECDCSATKSEIEEAQKAFDSLITTFGDSLFIKRSIINSVNELKTTNTLKKKK